MQQQDNIVLILQNQLYFFFRMVNEVLKKEMEDIHAFTQKTLTPEQWEKQKQAS